MRKKHQTIDSKDICIEKMVMMISTVISMEYIALDNMICFQLFLYENQFLMKLIFGELSRTWNYINVYSLLSINYRMR